MGICAPVAAFFGRQDLLAGVFDSYFVAHGGRVCLGGLRNASRVIEEHAWASDERTLSIYHLLNVVLSQTPLFGAR